MAAPVGLHDRPVLVVDAGMHTAALRRADVDAKGVYAVTGSEDRTVRIWSVSDGKLLRTIRMPVGPGDVGKVYSVAISRDGNLVAAGGWTRATEADPQEQIYLFDRQTGAMVRRLEGLPNTVINLSFSLDGRYLAATLFGGHGLRIYDREEDWLEVFRDTDYGGDSYGAAFAADGRLATTSFDGSVRLYHYDAGYRLKPRVQVLGGEALGIAFNPDGKRLAVGYHRGPRVAVFDGTTLDLLSEPDVTGIDNGVLAIVAWSADGNTLFAGGQYDRDGLRPVVAWSVAGSGERREFRASRDTIMSLEALAGGDLLVVSADPYLGLFAANGVERWARRPPQADFRDQPATLAVAADGSVIDFGYDQGGDAPARFGLNAPGLHLDPSDDGVTAGPEQATLPVKNWQNQYRPTLDGEALPLKKYEMSRSLAIHPDGARFVLGADLYLRAFDAAGEQLWSRAAPGIVWAVNITGDGRLVVAAYGDGTIRWHRMDDGRELLAFFPLADRKNWVAWTLEGLYAATPGARSVLRWHVNHGWDRPAEAIPVPEIPEQHRPDVLALVVQEMDEVRALGLAERKKIRAAVQRRTGGDPAGRLYLLAIGVSAYKDENAKHLRLRFADADARDLAAALIDSQQSLYAETHIQTLPNELATRTGILGALDAIKRGLMQAPGRDTAVVQFSGHGAVVDGQMYLLPHEVNPRNGYELKAAALAFSQLREELILLAQHGRVLVLLDACRSGTATIDGTQLVLDPAAARAALAAPNITVLTSTAPSDPSFEDERWLNGAFTEAVIDSLGSKADRDHDGLLSIGDIEWHVSNLLPQLTDGRQRLGIEKRFDGTIFVAGL